MSSPSGDHHQLRPKISTHRLSRKKLDVSLFERLVEGGRFNKAVLQVRPKHDPSYRHVGCWCSDCFGWWVVQVQLRMRPEIADLTRHNYDPPVQDHPRVSAYPAMRGLGSSVFFVSHKLPEDAVDRDALLLSKSHTPEAHFVMYLGSYLLSQVVSSSCSSLQCHHEQQPA